MEKIVFNSAAGEDIKISACFWPAASTPVGAVQICHGMAEHIARYEEFVKLLNENGFHVYGLDMPGHGESAALNDLPLGYFGKSEEASDAILADNMKLRELAEERFGSDIPYYIYGHSMGSFVVRSIYSKPCRGHRPRSGPFIYRSGAREEEGKASYPDRLRRLYKPHQGRENGF